MPEMMSIPLKFWATISDDRFMELCTSESYLSPDETRTVYRMQDLVPPEPIQCVQALIKESDLERILAGFKPEGGCND